MALIKLVGKTFTAYRKSTKAEKVVSYITFLFTVYQNPTADLEPSISIIATILPVVNLYGGQHALWNSTLVHIIVRVDAYNY